MEPIPSVQGDKGDEFLSSFLAKVTELVEVLSFPVPTGNLFCSSSSNAEEISFKLVNVILSVTLMASSRKSLGAQPVMYMGTCG